MWQSYNHLEFHVHCPPWISPNCNFSSAKMLWWLSKHYLQSDIQALTLGVNVFPLLVLNNLISTAAVDSALLNCSVDWAVMTLNVNELAGLLPQHFHPAVNVHLWKSWLMHICAFSSLTVSKRITKFLSMGSYIADEQIRVEHLCL